MRLRILCWLAYCEGLVICGRHGGAEPDRTERLDPAVIKLAAILVTGMMEAVFDTTIVNVQLSPDHR